MKKRIASLMLLLSMISVSAGAAYAVIFNEKSYQRCHDNKGVRIDSKECDPNACGCFFHWLEEYIKGMF